MPAKDGVGAGVLDAGDVRAMFDRIAGVYDLLNSAMTAGLHHRWRKLAAAQARLGPGGRVLDVATGTGDLALELAGIVGPDGSVIGSDFSEAMLARAEVKGAQAHPGALRFEWADAMNLPYPDDAFDAATVGFGARNFSDLRQGLSEMARVVRPGGRVVVLELTTPTRLPLSAFYGLWFDRVVPLLGRLAAAASARRGAGGEGAGAKGAAGEGAAGEGAGVGIGDAYTYLPSSVKRFPGPAELAGEMADVGLTEIRWLLTAGGIVAIHAATVQS